MLQTRYSEVAICILADCARANGHNISTLHAARGCGASADHAAQVVHRLVRLGLLKSARGKGGGIALAKPAEQMKLGEVLRQIQPDHCFRLRRENHTLLPRTLPVFRKLIDVAARDFLNSLNQHTLADLAALGDVAD